MSDEVLVIQTGGTIDKDYPRATGGYAFEICDSAAKKILTRLPLSGNFQFKTICKKDSQEMTLDDRKQLVKVIEASPIQKILVTHGTDTLIDSASFVADNNKGKLIVFTGAKKPEIFKDSDAEFNIGVAVGALRCIEGTGVYVAMNGRVSPWDKVIRDIETGYFIAMT
ncbi:unnamed protein product [Owenia fusiformis]|uniref:L-asparaginase N-terminal domain-containing protein n=1 Tax=Owenia fusiformis TaxID=6347 RepID=A0A8J1XYJ2_OWEFU|nr:unnamed protein product [Owenia fusiformis]